MVSVLVKGREVRYRLLASALFACLISAVTLAQEYKKTVTIEVYLPEGDRLFIEGQDTKSKGTMRRFVSPPLSPGKYIYTIEAIIPGANGPRTVTSRIDVRPGDFESIDLREPGKRPIADVEYEPTPQNVVDAALRLAKVTKKDVVWDLGCGDGRIPVTAAEKYGCKARGFDIDPERVKDSLTNVRKHGLERLVTIEKGDIFTLDLSKEPTIVTLYLLPRLNAKLLPQLRKLPPARASFRSRTGWPTSSRTSTSWLIRSWASSTSTCGRRRRYGASDRGDHVFLVRYDTTSFRCLSGSLVRDRLSLTQEEERFRRRRTDRQVQGWSPRREVPVARESFERRGANMAFQRPIELVNSLLRSGQLPGLLVPLLSAGGGHSRENRAKFTQRDKWPTFVSPIISRGLK